MTEPIRRATPPHPHGAMYGPNDSPPAGLSRGTGESVALHALGWLAAGNLVGLLLATLLLAPAAGAALGPLTYGRWMPVHWNAQLYGWLALPLVGLLLRLYRPGRIWERLAISLWSATLLVGCVSWLAGQTGGKPFLEWTGSARGMLVVDLVVLELALAIGLLRLIRARRATRTTDTIDTSDTRGAIGGIGRAGIVVRAALLAGLATIPVAMAVATSARVYPPINPDSGGPTGTSLLGSTLGIVWLFALIPAILDLSPRLPATREVTTATLALLGAHTVAFLALEALGGGNHSHHEAIQVVALASLIPWPLILWIHLRRFRYPEGAGPWLAALGGWGVLLVGTAFVTFLPGVLERWKFTNALVAHAHLAMAGMVTAFSALALLSLVRGTRLAGVLAAPLPFALWQLGCLIYVVSMMMLGTLEGIDPGLVIRSDPTSIGLYGFRWVAGVLMLSASVTWFARALRQTRASALAETAGTAGSDGARSAAALMEEAA